MSQVSCNEKGIGTPDSETVERGACRGVKGRWQGHRGVQKGWVCPTWISGPALRSI